MTDLGAEKIGVKVHFRITDYIALQLWCSWIRVHNLLICLIGGMLAGIAIVNLANGISVHELAEAISTDWPSYWIYPVMLVTIFFITIILTASARWLFRRRPHESQFLADDTGVGYSGKDFDLRIRWGNIRAFSETSAAFFIRGYNVYLRLPKRELSEQQIAAFKNALTSRNLRQVSVWRFA